MAYGKIKADALIHDNGGSDVEVSISDLAAKAGLASPTFTGTPAAPTAAQGTSTTQIATTAFVNAEIAADTAAKAPLADPTFTGVPAGPTAAVSTNTTQLATTAFVVAEIADEVGTTIQAFDADTAKTDVAQTYTAAQRGQKVTATGTSFTLDLNAANNFQISPSGTYTVALSNLATAAVGQTGSIFITPSATASGSFPTTMKFVGGAAGIALTGTSGSIDRIDYIVMDNTTVTCNFTANYVQ
jgi:hypothetical protein|tara:strand:- start:2906 stop:3634 length:729 start_codon:yes stop_codon:yes gene_type:complete